MLVSFELSMPSNNSWNGKWSGDDDLHCIVKSFEREPPKLGAYRYDFGDGWVASVAVREVTPSAAANLQKQSKGFCGYDWMMESIIRHGDIRND